MGIRKRSGELGRVKRGVTKTLGCRGFLDEMTSEEDGVGGRKRCLGKRERWVPRLQAPLWPSLQTSQI